MNVTQLDPCASALRCWNVLLVANFADGIATIQTVSGSQPPIIRKGVNRAFNRL